MYTFAKQDESNHLSNKISYHEENLLCKSVVYALIDGILPNFRGGNFAQAQTETSVTYTVASKTSVTASGTVPADVTATFSNNGTNNNDQLTSGKTMTLTLSGFNYKVEKVVLYMKRGSKGGPGNISIKVGDTEYASQTFVKSDFTTSYANKEFTNTSSNDFIGDITIVINATASSLYCSSFTIYYTETGPQLPDPELSFPLEEYEANIYTGFTAPTLTNKGDGAVTYTSSDETVATVNANTGAVTLVGAGITTIKAVSEKTDNYKAGNASYTLKVVDPAAPKYKKIISLDELVDGAQYVFVCETKSVAMGEVTGDKGQPVTGIALSDGILEGNTALNVFTLERDGDVCYFRDAQGKYLNGASSTNLNTIDKDLTSKGIKWTVTMDGEDVKVNNAALTSRYIIANSSNKFGNYDSSNYDNSGYGHIQLYRKVGEINAAETVDNYATFYVNYAYEMPEGMTGYAVQVEIGGKLTMKEAYKAGDAVPANTPLLLHGENAGTFHPAVLNKEVEAYDGYSDLEGTRNDEGYTESQWANVLYYKLAVNDEGKAGFFWGAENGAPFKMQKYTTAYLAAAEARVSNVRGFVFNPGEATGIDSVATETEENAPVYTLSGIRVRTAKSELPAGIYIMNGKKLMVK